MKKLKLLIVFLFVQSINVFAQSWLDVGGGVNNYVHALYVDSTTNLLYVGGDFSIAGAIFADGIAIWDGTNWSALNNPLSPLTCAAITKFNNLITFTDGYKIFQYDGNQVTVLDSSVHDQIYCMEVYSGELYVGGYKTIQGNWDSYIGKWNGTQIVQVGTGINARVNALKTYNGELYAGGDFTNLSGGINAVCLAKWNGTVWSNVGGQVFPNGVSCVNTYNGNLYVGGLFDIPGGGPGNEIAKWNGSVWSTVGNPLWHPFTNSVHSILGYNGNIYAGKGVTSVGNFIQKYDGTSWATVGSGLNDAVNTLAIYQGALYAGGQFTTSPIIQSTTVNHIAAYPLATGINENSADNSSIKIYPNLFSDKATLYLNESFKNKNAQLNIYDVLGNKLNEIQIKNSTAEINRENLSSGLYFYSVTSDKQILATGKFIVE